MNPVQFLRQHGLRGVMLRVLPRSWIAWLRRRVSDLRYWRQRDVILAWRHELKQAIEAHPDARAVFLFPPGLRWRTQLFQRPQQLARALARAGALVFYVEPPESPVVDGLHAQEPNLFLCKLPLRVFDALSDPLIYILTWNLGYLNELPPARIVYDYLDHLEVFHHHDRAELLREHERLLRDAALVTVTSHALIQDVKRLRPDALYLPNAVDIDHFRHDDALGDDPLDELQHLLSRGMPIIGYYGALATWVDYDLLRQLAQGRLDLSFLLIGPDYDGSIRRSGLEASANVSILGARSYEVLPRYLHAFDVAMIPFRLSEITHAVSPLKLFEYFAGGKPVVSTPLEEVMHCEGVLIGDNFESFSTCLDQALKLKEDHDYLERIRLVAQQNTWAVRARELFKHIEAS